jgi:2-polyprenyl-3-methyl-5-hydroxy-6-metoxy-1,4-benzoquinol methylase
VSLSSAIKSRLSPETKRKLRPLVNAAHNVKILLPSASFFSCFDPLSSDAAERLMTRLLKRRIDKRVRREWVNAKAPPHHSFNNYGAFRLAMLPATVGAFPFLRGFFAMMAVNEGDKVLDISCGDGFFSKRFFSTKATHVDAFDIETYAIEMANRYNADPKVSYFVRDAIADPFPSDGYDVVIWDGGIAHFPPGTNDLMMAKIRTALKPGGLFVGSESLGFDGSEDHLQRWMHEGEVRAMLSPYFKFVEVYTTSYFYNLERTGSRGEFYWRCSDSEAALDSLRWIRSSR